MLNIKQIIGFEGIYSISDCGKVFNQTKQLKTYFTRTGYECVKLTEQEAALYVNYLIDLHSLDRPKNSV